MQYVKSYQINSNLRKTLKFIVFTLILVLFSELSFSQNQIYSCDSFKSSYREISENSKSIIRKYEAEYFNLKRSSHNRSASTSISDIPVKVHVTRLSDGSQAPFNAVNETNVVDMIDLLNSNFETVFLNFYLCGSVNFIDDTDLNDFDINVDDESFINNHYDSEVVNILIVKSGISCGWAAGPNSNNDFIILTKGCSFSTTVPTHEMGHYFGLDHTHNGQFSADDKELVDGSNCEIAGDAICDTPADPQLSYSDVDDDCNYVGNETDANGEVYEPSTTNFMAYGRRPCRDNFSPQQKARMYATYKIVRTYLNCGNQSVNFVADKELVCSVPETVQFTDISEGAIIAWSWDVNGDDITDYTIPNPSHIYSEQGSYDVRLTVTFDDMSTLTKVYRDFIKSDDVIILNTDFIKLVFKTDDIPSKSRWIFSENGGNILFQEAYTSFTDSYTIFEYTFPVSVDNCYVFTIFNDFGTGLTWGDDNGYFALFDDDDNELVNKTAFHLKDATVIRIGSALNVNEVSNIENKISLYPNPADDILNIKVENQNAYSVRVFDILGKHIYNNNYNSSHNILNTSSWQGGLYFVKLYNINNEFIGVGKVVVN